MNQSKKLLEIHTKALRQFNAIYPTVEDERQQCIQDRRFYSIAGAQWEGALEEQFENKPKFEVNKVHLSVMRIINEYRNNRITVDFQPKDGALDNDLCDTCNGLYRADEADSVADEAYDNAFEEAAGGGFGAFRLTTEYEDEEDDEDDRQRIRIEPIYDADSCVFFDINAKRQDKSDAKHAFILTEWNRDGFEEMYPDVDPASWPNEVAERSFDWCSKDRVYTAEYFVVDEVPDEVMIYENKVTGDEERHRKSDLDEDETGILIRLKATGYKKAGSKKIKRKVVRKYLMTGAEIIEDMGVIAGKHIPIVPVYGKRWYVEGIERCMGHVRLAKDAQRIKNMQTSWLGDIAAQSSYKKPIFTPEQVAGHEMEWANDSVDDLPYMKINAIEDKEGNEMPMGPVGFTSPPELPPAAAALLQLTDVDIRDLLGNQEAGEELTPNLSGKAVELIQNRLDMQSFIYMSNFAKSVRRSGEIWLSMANEVYVEDGRNMKTLGTTEGEYSMATLRKPLKNEDTGETYYENDISRAKFDVVSDVGPSSASKRSATVRALSSMISITDDPETKQVLGSMVMLNMEGEGVSEVRKYFRQKLLRMGVIEPTDEEQAELQKEAENAQPDANEQYLQAASVEAQAKATKAEADTVYAHAKAEESKAKTAETLAGIDRDDRDQVLKAVEQATEIRQPAAVNNR